MSLRVLLADESASIKKVFQLGLQDFAAEVKSVQSGVDVIEVAETFQPDIIFADILLQKLNGYDVCLEIKQHPTLKNVPFVLMWSSFMELDQKKFQESGAQGEIEKPFDVDAMRDQIHNLVPEVQDQHLGSFLKFPSSLTQEFIQEEGQRVPPAPSVDGLGVISIPPAPEPMEPEPVESISIMPPPEPLTLQTTEFEIPESIAEPELEEDTSVFNNQDGDFEFETLENDEILPETSPASISESLSAPDPMDITQWKVKDQDSHMVESLSAEEVSPSEELEEDLEIEEDTWQSASLTEVEPSSQEVAPEASIDGFESMDIKHDASEPLDLESFLYQPGEENDVEEPLEVAPLPDIANVVVRHIEEEEEEISPAAHRSSAIPSEDLERMVAEQVAKQLSSSDTIESIVRAHAQEVIKMNIIEQLPQIIEKIAREELDKILKEEIAEASDLGSNS